ncbi:hypothetical protein HMPREF1544_02131 [Mucor circinelloides 1006PhL]|uniref:Uncharacterized protein n=1 Tax=Mucor circinelloides f. circinelloides (strain 1006PhL) TaxID=1220926 RepID=S2JRC0_MUCC1|nr:hypothetical protein HMPREF1544_02131 [Mucor circinelloides 1006PhL]
MHMDTAYHRKEKDAAAMLSSAMAKWRLLFRKCETDSEMIFPCRELNNVGEKLEKTMRESRNVSIEFPEYDKARQTINHIENAHGSKPHPRVVGHRRPESTKYAYINNSKTRSDFEVYHCSCPLCWYHCPCDDYALTALANHVNETHHPQNVDTSKNDDGCIRDSPVNYVARNEALPEARDDEEEMKAPKARARPKNKKKDTNQLGINDLYPKVVDLTEMFKYLASR